MFLKFIDQDSIRIVSNRIGDSNCKVSEIYKDLFKRFPGSLKLPPDIRLISEQPQSKLNSYQFRVLAVYLGLAPREFFLIDDHFLSTVFLSSQCSEWIDSFLDSACFNVNNSTYLNGRRGAIRQLFWYFASYCSESECKELFGSESGVKVLPIDL